MSHACVLIPVFDHGAFIGSVLAGLEPYGLPVLLVDDGSGPETRAVLDRLAAERPGLTLIRRRANGGKGAAIRDGLRAAAERGFSHAITVDADGQHDLADLPRFLEAIRRDPGALVLGAPLFDESAPKSRLYGRLVSCVWVWIETLSRTIRDPLCGYRAYPLAPVLEVLERRPPGLHMDFDPEIAVRCVWAGLPVIAVETRVRYRPDGISHFRPLADNLRISWMHTRLFFGMLPRAPGLLLRRRSRR